VVLGVDPLALDFEVEPKGTPASVRIVFQQKIIFIRVDHVSRFQVSTLEVRIKFEDLPILYLAPTWQLDLFFELFLLFEIFLKFLKSSFC
jgi:hypothetical protein